MRITRIDRDGEPRTVVVDDDTVTVLDPGVDPLALLAIDAAGREELVDAARERIPLADARLLAPLLPTTIRDFSVFEAHITGVIRDANPDATVPPRWYESPFCYFSNPHAITGPGEEIAVPPGCERLDLELEVAAVIGRAGYNLSPDQARDHIAGYTIFNDWSARDLQMDEMKLGLGPCKGKDFANTLGPWIVTADELEAFRDDDDRLDLEMRAEINGEPLGTDTLAHMAWSFPELVAYASRGTWVRPGDVLGSGTCASGCLLELWGRGSTDHAPLGPGDVVSLHVQGIGTLTNTVVAGPSIHPLGPARA